jgi:hypothetical protein
MAMDQNYKPHFGLGLLLILLTLSACGGSGAAAVTDQPALVAGLENEPVLRPTDGSPTSTNPPTALSSTATPTATPDLAATEEFLDQVARVFPADDLDTEKLSCQESDFAGLARLTWPNIRAGSYSTVGINLSNYSTEAIVHWIRLSYAWTPEDFPGVQVEWMAFHEPNPYHYPDPFAEFDATSGREAMISLDWEDNIPLVSVAPAAPPEESNEPVTASINSLRIRHSAPLAANNALAGTIEVTFSGEFIFQVEDQFSDICSFSTTEMLNVYGEDE